MNVLMSKDFLRALTAAGIITEEAVSVVIQAKYGEVVTIYVEQFGDNRLLNVTQTLSGAVISRDEPEEQQKHGEPA